MKLIEWLRQLFIEDLAEEKQTLSLNELSELTSGDLAIKHEKPTREEHIEYPESNSPQNSDSKAH